MEREGGISKQIDPSMPYSVQKDSEYLLEMVMNYWEGVFMKACRPTQLVLRQQHVYEFLHH